MNGEIVTNCELGPACGNLPALKVIAVVTLFAVLYGLVQRLMMEVRG